MARPTVERWTPRCLAISAAVIMAVVPPRWLSYQLHQVRAEQRQQMRRRASSHAQFPPATTPLPPGQGSVFLPLQKQAKAFSLALERPFSLAKAAILERERNRLLVLRV